MTKCNVIAKLCFNNTNVEEIMFQVMETQWAPRPLLTKKTKNREDRVEGVVVFR